MEKTSASPTQTIDENSPWKADKLSVKNTMEDYSKLNSWEARHYSTLILLESSGTSLDSASDHLTSLTAFRIQNDRKIEDKTCQKVWDRTQKSFKILPESEQLIWKESGPMHCLSSDSSSVYDKHTHCIVDLFGYYIRYSLQSYRGISTWYIHKLSEGQRPSDRIAEPPKITFHPFYGSPLAPISWRMFRSLENLSALTWGGQHRDCRQNHFRINVYLTGQNLTGPSSKYITHRVCGDTYVTDLFRAFLGCTQPRKDSEEPKNWQGFRQVQWDESVKYTIDGTPLVNIGPLYDFESVKKSRATMKDMEWFKLKDYAWLLPCKKCKENKANLSLGWHKGRNT